MKAEFPANREILKKKSRDWAGFFAKSQMVSAT
jgi:hypothetical protein